MCPDFISDLPPEMLECILLSLSPADILKMKEVSHRFLDFVSNSQYLQHRIDLLREGLIDNPHVTSNLAKRRERLRKYVDGWNNPELTPVQCDCLLSSRMDVLRPHHVGQDLLMLPPDDRIPVISFIRIPPSPIQGTVEEWTIELPFPSEHCLVCSEVNLLAVIQHGTGFVNVHLLNLLDGRPHEVPIRKVLSQNWGHNGDCLVTSSQISGSKIALLVKFVGVAEAEAESLKELIAWDWKTGQVVLERSSNDPGIGDVISGVYRLCFLEGPWLLALSHRGSDFRILVFNTPLPQQDPRSWRILELPALTRGCYLFLPRYGESLAGCPEFSVDPARRIFAVLLPRWAIVISVGPFIRGMSSVHASPYLQWGDWGEYAIKTRFHSNSSNPNIFGTKVLVLDSRTRPKTFLVEIYDLGEDVQRLIQRSDEGYGGVLLTPRWTATFQKGEPPKRAYFLGDKLVCFYRRPLAPGEEYYLRIWKIC